jgi:hypothetical protein
MEGVRFIDIKDEENEEEAISLIRKFLEET